MQNTLAEVELSAVNSHHVLGSDHSKALEDLRTKQLALAQAWARNEAAEVVDHSAEDTTASVKGGETEPTKLESQATEEGFRKTVDEETEKDILLARKRRDANDRYFNRVSSGVLDVVAKLEEVALAMRVVERKSKEIWGAGEDGDAEAVPSKT
jgi:hypothetical protein